MITGWRFDTMYSISKIIIQMKMHYSSSANFPLNRTFSHVADGERATCLMDER